MDAKHTPGPWEMGEAGSWEDGLRTATEYFVRRPGDDVAIASDIIDPANDDTPSEANARLIAAAPELLAALKELAALMPVCGNDHDISVRVFQVPTGSVRKALAAIAKAEGRAE